MSEDIGRAFDLQRSNPFELKNVHIMHSLEELDELGNDPKVRYTSIFDGQFRETPGETTLIAPLPLVSLRLTWAT